VKVKVYWEVVQEIKSLLGEGKKIDAIRRASKDGQLGLKQAKELVEALADGSFSLTCGYHPTPSRCMFVFSVSPTSFIILG